MKLIVAILRDTDNDPVSRSLTNAGFRVTYIASTGGFWRRGQSTLLIGVEDNQMEDALVLLRKTVTKPTESDKSQTTIFVLKVDQFSQF
jgi:uncharacterized protein YaaQ